MPATNLKAEPDPRGGRITLSWTNPIMPGFKGVKILRRESTYPGIPADLGASFEVFDDATTPAGQDDSFVDQNLNPEVIYYYAVVAYDNAANFSPAFISAMPTAPYKTADRLYRDLPGIYQTYDTVKPSPAPGLDPDDLDKGQLRRWVEMFGLQFDLLRSFASGTKSFFDSQQIDGQLLPLLAEWIAWPTDFTLSYAKQRNQTDFAPHYYATTGIAANVRATINRITTWNARIKEFAHNIFLSGNAEELTIRKLERKGNVWQPLELVTLDVAFAGRPSFLLAGDGKPVAVYHQLERVPVSRGPGLKPAEELRWQLRYKVFGQDRWLSARALPLNDNLNILPAAVQRGDRSMWVFWSSLATDGPDRKIPQIRLMQASLGRPAESPRLQGSATAPFGLADGDAFNIAITAQGSTISRSVVFRAEDFNNIAQASAAEVRRVLDRELPGVDVNVAGDGSILLTSQSSGTGAKLSLPASVGAAKLGLAAGAKNGVDAVVALLTGTRAEPFALADNDTLVVTVDGDVPRTVLFKTTYSTAILVAAAINKVVPGVASVQAGKIALTSLAPGEGSMIAVNSSASTAAAKLGFAVPPPAQASPVLDDTEPTAFADPTGNVWLFWSSFRTGSWRIWYSRFDGNAWGVPKQLTTTALPDREPAVLFDPAAPATIWVFWSRQNASGRWNIFFKTTSSLDFNAQVWTADTELQPLGGAYDNREPAPLLAGAKSIELYFSSNRSDGWNIWSKPITPTNQGADSPVTTGPFTQRAPAPLSIAPGRVQVLFRSNESQSYTSALFPSTQTIDSRYSGSTTADTRNPTRLSLRGNIKDIQHYTYDTPKQAPDKEARRLYSRDTIGIYLAPDTGDQQLIIRTQAVIASVLQRFLPMQVRAVFLVDQTFVEYVYGYDQAGAQKQPSIGEQTTVKIVGGRLGSDPDRFADRVDLHFPRTRESGIPAGLPSDLPPIPPNAAFHVFEKGVPKGG